jgi:two-component system LytT family response regulator
MSISCLIIEDNINQSHQNKETLLKHFSSIDPIEQALSLEEASGKINKADFDIILADVHLEDGIVFDLLKEFKQIRSKIIFTTSHSEYAIEAFKFSALSYLLKPYTEDELISEVNKTIAIIDQENYHQQLEVFFYNLKPQQPSKRLVLKNHDLIHIVDMDSILYAQADNNYTHFFCEDRKILVSKSLKTFEEQLIPHKFFRCHHSYLVNLQKIKALHKSGDAIILKNDSSIPVASSKKKLLYQLIQ